MSALLELAERCVCARRSYGVEIPVDDFVELSDWLDEQDAGAPEYCKMGNEMHAAVPGVGRIEMNGHFGNFVYFELDADDDTPANRAALVKVIDDNVAAALRSRAAMSPDTGDAA